MSDVQIKGRSAEKATLLLAAVEELGLDVSVVRTTSSGYIVPEDVADEAGLSDGEAKPAKKAPAKKTTAKKAAAKKSGGEE